MSDDKKESEQAFTTLSKMKVRTSELAVLVRNSSLGIATWLKVPNKEALPSLEAQGFEIIETEKIKDDYDIKKDESEE
jgi:hypothetical protein